MYSQEGIETRMPNICSYYWQTDSVLQTVQAHKQCCKLVLVMLVDQTTLYSNSDGK